MTFTLQRKNLVKKIQFMAHLVSLTKQMNYVGKFHDYKFPPV